MAPERITGNIKTEDLELNKRTDMWSIGVIIYVLFSGHLPFYSHTCQELYENIKKSEFMFPGKEWENVPMSAKQLISEMLRQDPLDRIDSALAINHQFFMESNQDLSRMQETGGSALIPKNNWV
jgi:serine/threonine protein kinase